MKILVLNCGSSSLKYQLIDMKKEQVMAKGIAERIGIEGSVLNHKADEKEKVSFNKEFKDHSKALELIVGKLLSKEYGVINSIDEINAVGHRVAHGGEKCTESVIINDYVKSQIKELIALAPLHNPANLLGIEACERLLPGVPMVAVFDTSFHQTMPKYSYLYPLPYEYYEKYAVRRYGFHGTSHKYIAHRAAEILGKSIGDLKIISCHLGNGSSVAAIKNGKSIDTSMGFTPLEGLAMGTRCGSIDSGIIKFLMEHENMTIEDIDNMMNKKSGVLGISGISSDFRDLEDAAEEGNERAQLALDIFNFRLIGTIGEYAAKMNGVDLILFTGGIGENGISNRKAACESLEFLGVKMDEEKNQINRKEIIISTPDSKVTVMIVPTNEELMIARDTKMLIENK